MGNEEEMMDQSMNNLSMKNIFIQIFKYLSGKSIK